MALSRQTGTARIIAIAVTPRVPIMNGKNPKSPLMGCQDVEKRRCERDTLTRIGFAFM
jgi:hypothetical protein